MKLLSPWKRRYDNEDISQHFRREVYQLFMENQASDPIKSYLAAFQDGYVDPHRPTKTNECHAKKIKYS